MYGIKRCGPACGIRLYSTRVMKLREFLPGPSRLTIGLRVILRVVRLMNERLESPMSVSEIASKANMSERNFRKVFKQHTGKTPKDFYIDIRMEHALSFLRRGYTVEKVAYLMGFKSPFYFSNAFNKHFGYRPSNAGKLHKKPSDGKKQ